MQIIRGKVAKAQKVVIYGVEGIGKSTLASHFPNPVFIDIEGSTGNMDVARFEKPTSYEMLKQQIKYIYQNPDVCKTIVIDTVDWVERMIIDNICMAANKTDITQFGYGEGFIKLEQELGSFLNSLSDLVEKGVNVVLTAHSIIRKFEQPDEMGAYDRYELKLGNKTTGKTAAIVKEWADMVLFCNYKTQVLATDDKGKKHKAQGGKRVMYAQHHPAWDAKNRHGLPFEMPMDYDSIAYIFNKQAEHKAMPKEEPISLEAKELAEDVKDVFLDNGFPDSIKDLMKINNITELDIRKFWKTKGHFPEDMEIKHVPNDYWNMLKTKWDSVIKTLNK